LAKKQAGLVQKGSVLMKSELKLSRTSVHLLALAVLLSIVLFGSPSFAEETGSIEVMLEYTNGDKHDPWESTLKIFQEGNDEPYLIVEAPESNPYLIDSLPQGYRYTIEVYVNNMFANSEFLYLDDSEAKLELSIPLSAGTRFVVLYDDGQTPIEGTTVLLKSYDDHQWRQDVTDADGKTKRFWAQPNNLVESDYYIAEVSMYDDLVYSHSPITFSPSSQQDIKIVTPWPKIIDKRISILVYKDASQKVTKLDGDFVVEFYDMQNNKVSQSHVNIRGDAFISSFNVGKYFVQVVKSAPDPAQESKVWATKTIVLTGEEDSISIFKSGILFQDDSIMTCNCVAFRLDDVQDYYLRESQVAVMELFQQKNADLTIGVIGSAFGGDPHLVDFLNNGDFATKVLLVLNQTNEGR